MQQVWRPYDTAVIENGIKGRVVNVCFHTRSVRIMMPQGSPEWFKYDMIVEHKSATGAPEDLVIIESLTMKLDEANRRIEKLEAENARMDGKLKSRNIEAIGKNLNEIGAILNIKKKRIEKLEGCMDEIQAIVEKMNAE